MKTACRAFRQRFGEYFSLITDTHPGDLLQEKLSRSSRCILKAPRQSARCVPCPKCGVWVVIQVGTAERKIDDKDKHRTPTTSRMLCPKCAQAFDVDDKDTRMFRVEPHIFERMYFYPSDIKS